MNRKYAIAGTCLLSATLLGVFLGQFGRQSAQGQGMVSEAGTTIVVVGPERNSRLPIVLVDTREMTMCIYRYDFNANSLELSVARSYQWDKKLEEYGSLKGAKPDEVRRHVQR